MKLWQAQKLQRMRTADVPSKTVKIPDFTPRDYQLPLLCAMDNGCTRAMLIWHRRCLDANSHILMGNGSYKLLKDIKVGDEIISYSDQKLVKDTVKNIWPTGLKNCSVATSYSARSITITDDHQILNTTKYWYPTWRRFADRADRFAVTFDQVLFNQNIHDENLAEFLGYLMTDSFADRGQKSKFTNVEKSLLNRVEELARIHGMDAIRTEKGNAFDIRFIRGNGNGKIHICKLKKDKRIPSVIWEMDYRSVGRFFSSVIDCDGRISIKKIYTKKIYIKRKKRFSKEITTPHVEVTISIGESEALAWDHYWLLRKFGIHAHAVNNRGHCWIIRIRANKSVKKFLSWITTLSREKMRLKALALKLPGKNRKIYSDNFLVARLYSKKIIKTETYDLETHNYGNFIADGYIVHNSGKEVVCWNDLIKRAFFHRIGTYVYFFPTQRLGRRILWDGMDKGGKRFLSYIPREIIDGNPNSVEMKIRLINGSVIQIMGTDQTINVGINPIGCVFSEFALQDPASWNYIRPILRENGGWAIFNTTPRGKNHAYDLYIMAKHNPDWFCQVLSINETGILTAEDIQKERNEGMSETLIQQEYYCDWSKGVEGSYYAKLLNDLELKGHITSLPIEPYAQVHTYWDLGVADETAVLFVQNVGKEIHIIDMYRNQGEGLQHYARVLKEKGDSNKWIYGGHFAPHDIKVRELGSGAMTRLEIARELGIEFEIVPNLPIAEGIELARGLFPRLWIDQNNCNYLIKSLEGYHKYYNETLNVFSDKPVHDAYSHTADAFRYMSIMHSIQSTHSMDEREADELESKFRIRI